MPKPRNQSCVYWSKPLGLSATLCTGCVNERVMEGAQAVWSRRRGQFPTALLCSAGLPVCLIFCHMSQHNQPHKTRQNLVFESESVDLQPMQYSALFCLIWNSNLRSWEVHAGIIPGSAGLICVACVSQCFLHPCLLLLNLKCYGKNVNLQSKLNRMR